MGVCGVKYSFTLCLSCLHTNRFYQCSTVLVLYALWPGAAVTSQSSVETAELINLFL